MNFLWNWQAFSKCAILHSHYWYIEGSQLLYILANIWSGYSDFRHCNWYLVSLVCISVMTNDEHLFKCLFTILVLANCSNILLTFHWLFLWLSFENCLFCIETIIRYCLQSFPSLWLAFLLTMFFLTFCLFLTLLDLQMAKYKGISTWVLANYVVEYT